MREKCLTSRMTDLKFSLCINNKQKFDRLRVNELICTAIECEVDWGVGISLKFVFSQRLQIFLVLLTSSA